MSTNLPRFLREAANRAVELHRGAYFNRQDTDVRVHVAFKMDSDGLSFFVGDRTARLEKFNCDRERAAAIMRALADELTSRPGCDLSLAIDALFLQGAL